MELAINSTPWHDIADTYRSLVEHDWDMQPMLSLVEEIADSRYADGVFATTSMGTLCVAQAPVFELNRNMLRVDFERGRFVFDYRETPLMDKSWKKECGRDEGFSTFEHVIARLKWFLN